MHNKESDRWLIEFVLSYVTETPYNAIMLVCTCVQRIITMFSVYLKD